jgi:hypothetical protein
MPVRLTPMLQSVRKPILSATGPRPQAICLKKRHRLKNRAATTWRRRLTFRLGASDPKADPLFEERIILRGNRIRFSLARPFGSAHARASENGPTCVQAILAVVRAFGGRIRHTSNN